MNLTGRPVYIKSEHTNRPPNAAERKLWDKILRVIGCIVRSDNCGGRNTIHHCGTRRGGRKNHKKVLGLCWNHHLGKDGIDGKVVSTAKWEAINGTEDYLMEKQRKMLHEKNG